MENTELIKKCVELCNRCIEDCLLAANQNQVIPGMDECVRLSLLCAHECEGLVKLSGDKKQVSGALYDRCMAGCANCAAECEHHLYDHCRRCAASCRKFQLAYIFESYKLQQPIYQHYAKA